MLVNVKLRINMEYRIKGLLSHLLPKGIISYKNSNNNNNNNKNVLRLSKGVNVFLVNQLDYHLFSWD